MSKSSIAIAITTVTLAASVGYGFLKARKTHTLIQKVFARGRDIDQAFSKRLAVVTGAERSALELRQIQYNSQMFSFRMAYLARSLTDVHIKAYYAEMPEIDSI